MAILWTWVANALVVLSILMFSALVIADYRLRQRKRKRWLILALHLVAWGILLAGILVRHLA